MSVRDAKLCIEDEKPFFCSKACADNARSSTTASAKKTTTAAAASSKKKKARVSMVARPNVISPDAAEDATDAYVDSLLIINTEKLANDDDEDENDPQQSELLLSHMNLNEDLGDPASSSPPMSPIINVKLNLNSKEEEEEDEATK